MRLRKFYRAAIGCQGRGVAGVHPACHPSDRVSQSRENRPRCYPPTDTPTELNAFRNALKTASDSLQCTPLGRAERVLKRRENRQDSGRQSQDARRPTLWLPDYFPRSLPARGLSQRGTQDPGFGEHATGLASPPAASAPVTPPAKSSPPPPRPPNTPAPPRPPIGHPPRRNSSLSEAAVLGTRRPTRGLATASCCAPETFGQTAVDSPDAS